MALTDPAQRPSAGARRTGYRIAIAFSAALLFVLNGRPGWQEMPFLTSDTSQVLWLVNLSLAAGTAANVVYLAYDPPWLKSLGDLATTGIGLATAIRIWQVFPFALSSGWSTAVRVLLVVAIAGSCIALVVQIVSLARWFTGHTPLCFPRGPADERGVRAAWPEVMSGGTRHYPGSRLWSKACSSPRISFSFSRTTRRESLSPAPARSTWRWAARCSSSSP
jgi:hypothetical protein